MQTWELFVPYWGVIKATYLYFRNDFDKLPFKSEQTAIYSGILQLLSLLIFYFL